MESTSTHAQELYERYGFLIQRTCRGILKSEEDAQDALHIVFVKLLEHYDSIKDKELVVPWIFRAAKNHCFNVLRYNKKFSDTQESCDTPGLDRIDDSFASKDIIKRVLGQFSRKIQDAVYFTYLDQYDQKEIQKIIGQSPATVRRNLKKFNDSLPAIRKRLGL